MNEGCMVCRQRTRLTSEMIKRELPILKRGDHIEMPLKDSIFGTFLKHHAIVDSYKVGEEFVQDPELYVVEVSRDVDQSNQNERVEQCNAKKQKKIEIKRNKYDGKLEDITLIEYRKRKYHHTDTYNRAMSFVGNKSNYNLVLKNCEHFTAACVNGEHTLSIDNWKSVSVQTLQLFWAIVDILFAVFQCAFFYHNFTDWMFGYLWAATLGTCEGVFLALFLFFFVLEYFLFKPNTRVCVCSECLTARYIMFVVKALLFAIIEIGNEFLVQPFFYDKDCVKLVSLSLPEILSIVEGVSIMFIAPRLTKVVIFFLGSKRLKWLWNICKFEEDAYKHVLHYISLHDIDVAVKNCFLMCGTSIFRPSRTTTDPDDLINEYDWS